MSQLGQLYFARAYKTKPADDRKDSSGDELRAISVWAMDAHVATVVKAPMR